MPTITKDIEVDIEVELEDFEDSDIVEYVREKGLMGNSNSSFNLETLFQKLIVKGWDYDSKRFVEDWIYEEIGRAV